MADNTPIEWTDATWNPVTGCAVVSPGCTNCYAMRLAGTRMKHHPSRQGLTTDTKAGPVWTGQVRLNEDWLDQPLRWRRPRRIFVCAHGDLFAEAVPDEWIDRVFAAMALCPQHTFQVLTKRAQRMRDYVRTLAGDWMVRLPDSTPDSVAEVAHEALRVTWPLPNVWLGVSVEDQIRADLRIPPLLDTPASKRFISAEPLLGPVDLSHIACLSGDPRNKQNALTREFHLCGETGDGREVLIKTEPINNLPRLDWVIAGGESGKGARPMHPDWARDLRDQCQAAAVPFFFKQHGEFIGTPDLRRLPGGTGPGFGTYDHCHYDMDHEAVRVGKAAAGRLLDGREWSEFPA